MLVLELFQYVDVGGIAGLGLLSVGKLQSFKEQRAQLLGGIDVKGAACIAVDQVFAVGDSLAEHLLKGGEGVAVYENTGVLHFGQHRAQGKINVPIDLLHALLLDLFGQNGVELGNGGGFPCQTVGNGGTAIALHQVLEGIARAGGLQQIGGQRSVIGKALNASPLPQKLGHHGFAVVDDFSGLRGKYTI